MLPESGDGSQLAFALRKGPVWSSTAEKLKYVSPSLPHGSQFQKHFKPSALRAFEHQKVHARSVHGILYPFQKPGIDKCITRFCDLLHVITHKSGELLVRQERPRMSIQEHQQIEFTSARYDRSAREQSLDISLPSRVGGQFVAHNVVPAPLS
jgi:hypothetical protein